MLIEIWPIARHGRHRSCVAILGEFIATSEYNKKMTARRIDATDEVSGSLLRAMSEAILELAGEPRLARVLQTLVEGARELVSARYAAVGVPDDAGEGFEEFIYTGMSDELVARIGPLPRKHGLLGAMLLETEPLRTPDIRRDPRFRWWPDAHPKMSSFLGVPIVSKGRVIGAFYLTAKRGASEVSLADQVTIEMLAAPAEVAIEMTRLYERSRELSVVEERNRLARDLHDSVSQTLFSMLLTAEAALLVVDSDPETAKRELVNLRDSSRTAMREMRALIFELRPADLEEEGLVATLEKHAEVLRRTTGFDVAVRSDGYQPQPVDKELAVFRIVQEALNNAIRHSGAREVEVAVAQRGGTVTVVIADSGVGFDASDSHVSGRRLGITSMKERAKELGGKLSLESGSGEGTRVVLEVPVG
ncbi:MAG: GAF domain-containing sensor histidine kinase [Dehalococcoidia bacterium]